MSIKIDYKYRDGWHVFTSKDLPGLYVASPNLKAAVCDVPWVIRYLQQVNK